MTHEIAGQRKQALSTHVSEHVSTYHSYLNLRVCIIRSSFCTPASCKLKIEFITGLDKKKKKFIWMINFILAAYFKPSLFLPSHTCDLLPLLGLCFLSLSFNLHLSTPPFAMTTITFLTSSLLVIHVFFSLSPSPSLPEGRLLHVLLPLFLRLSTLTP